MWSNVVFLCCLAVTSCFGGLAQNRFALDFFKHAYIPQENAFLAPIAIQSGLAMMHHVATPEAARIMQDALYLPSTASEVTKQTKDLINTVNRQKDSLEMLSKVYLPNETLNPEMVSHLRDSFGIDSEIVNFAEQSEVVDRVNTWVNDYTRGKIPDFLQAEELSKLTTSLLINVMVMNASWGFFDEKDTKKQNFHFLNGDHQVDMMKVDGTLPHIGLDDLMTDAIKLPYGFYEMGPDLSMIILLPRKGVNLENVIKRFNGDHYDQLARLDYDDEWFGNIVLGVPRFKIEQKLDARSTLEKMGLGQLFNQEGFQVLETELSKLGLVKQSTFIKVDEKGTEAVAATAIASSFISGPWVVDVDRPFMFIIRQESTRNIMFIGHYSNYDE